MKKLISTLFSLTIFLLPFSSLYAHHNTHSEFGWFDTPTMSFEGKIVKIAWGNPHVAIDVENSVGEKWRLVSHPINVTNTHGFKKEQFAVGDTLKVIGWKHLRGKPLIWLRAIQNGDGPMLSIMRFSDMQDIANGTLEQLNITPAASLAGSSPQRAGPEAVKKLGEMGLLDDEGLVIWPPP
jgi:hypothetical protein